MRNASLTSSLSVLAVGVLFAPASRASDSAPALPDSSNPFYDVARVLQSPRCLNCHPVGDAPLQTDVSTPHKQDVKRSFSSLGGSCHTCHQKKNLAGDHSPPGAPHWTMPTKDFPMVFQGKSVASLCRDLKDLEKNGHRTLQELLSHVRDDELVKWGWNPGQGRTLPPLSHEETVRKLSDWISLGAPCPEETGRTTQ